MTAQTKQEEQIDKALDILIECVIDEDNPENVDFRKAKREVQILVEELINSEVLSVLEELEKSSTHYTPDGLVADALDPWATSVDTIQSIKNRYKL